MALDIGVGSEDRRSRPPLQDEPGLSLDNDGYYRFLHPLFEKLAAETGQYLDLYGDARFHPASLPALERMLAAAEKLVRAQSARWQVHVGTQTKPERKELYHEVEKARFLELLGEWRKVVARAKQMQRAVVCFGD
jgi:hypothetical protein